MPLIDKATRAESQTKAEALAIYRKSITSLNDSNDERELADFRAAMKTLGLTIDDAKADFDVHEQVAQAQRRLDQQVKTMEEAGSSNAMQGRLHELDEELKEKIRELLQPKRLLIEAIAHADSSAEHLHNLKKQMADLQKQSPYLYG